MSTGPGPGTGGTGTDTGPDPDDPASFFTRLSLAINQPRVWIVSILLGIPLTVSNLNEWAGCNAQTAAELQMCTGIIAERVAIPLSQKSAVAVLLDHWVFRTVLAPAGAYILGLFASGVSTIQNFFAFIEAIELGTAGAFVGGAVAAGEKVVGTFNAFNLGLVGPVTALGVGAQPAATAIAALELAGIPLFLWAIARIFDVPFINPLGFILAITRPIRNFWRLFF